MARPVKQEIRTLCEVCGNACGGCSWANDLIPVDGWTAQQTFDKYGDPYSYIVTACPRFLSEEEGRYRPTISEMVNEGTIGLVSKMVELAKIDYIHGGEGTKTAVEHFLNRWLQNPEDALIELKRQAKEHDRRQLENLHGAI